MTEFLKTVDIFVKRDTNHLGVAFWLLNSSMELVLDCRCFIVKNREALEHYRGIEANKNHNQHHRSIDTIRDGIVIHLHLSSVIGKHE